MRFISFLINEPESGVTVNEQLAEELHKLKI